MTTKTSLSSGLMASLLVLGLSGCGVLDDIVDDGEVFAPQGRGFVYMLDNATVYGLTTNNVSLEDNGIALYDANAQYNIGWISQDHTVLDSNGDFVANCIANETGDDFPSFTDDGYLQGSCHLDREVPNPLG